MSWCNVEDGFGGEETANFGPRHESGTALYQVETLATISPQDEVYHNPRLFGCSSYEGLCVAASNDLSIFDGNGQQFRFTLNFDTEVEVVCWSDDSAFLVVAETSGFIHIVDVKSKQILYSQQLLSQAENGHLENGFDHNISTFNNIILQQQNNNGSYNLTISATNDSCYLFSNILLKELCQALQNRDIAAAKKATEQESYSKATEVYSVTKVEKQTEEAGVKESIQMECINTSEVHTESNNNAVICDNTLDMNLVTIGKGDSCVTVWQEENNTMQPYMLSAHMMPDQGYLKCKISHDNKFIFLLDNQNNLSMLDFKSLVTCAYWSTIKVQDFILMTVGSVQTMDKDGDLGYGFRVIVLTVPNPECYLQVYSLPGMKLTYSLEVGCHSALVDAPLSQDTIFLIEGVRSDDDFDNDNGLVATLRVRCLTEALPDTRFHRLLHKKRFEEAIQFAQQFGQDVQLVYKVKSCHINDLVAPWSNQSDDVDIAQLFVSYKDCMEHIQDIEYVTESCTNTDFPNYSCIVDLLNYARFRVNGSSKNSNNSKTTELMAMIMKVQHRLDTYNMTYGVKNFSGPKWSQFLDADLLTECIDMLSKGQIGTAATIWKRHQCEFEDNFTEKVLENILSSIPENIKSEDIIPWLDNEIIPFVIEVLPSAQNLLALWLIKKARDMELSEKDDWPNNALEMAQLLFKSGRSIEHSEQGRKITTPSEFSTLICNHSVTCMNNTKQNTSITLLQKLIQNLKDLINLHKEYKCKLTLAEFSKETTSTITFRMLDRVVAPELIPQSITKVVRPYMKQHNLAEEELLFHYIKDLTDRCGNISSYAYESSWEAKAVAVIHCIKDLDYFYQAILSMMLKVTVPWSDLVENLVRKGLSFDHPRVEQLKQVHEFVKLRTIILKYDLYNFNISSETMAPYLLKYFLTKDLPCAMEDALQVVKVYPNIVKPDDVYMFRLRFLVQQERIPECIDLLKVIPKADCIKCANRLLIYCLTVLNAEEEETDEYLECQHEEKVTFTETGIAVIQFLIKIEEEPAIQGDLQTLLTQLKCILSLQRQYSIFLTLDTYRNPTLRDEILTSYLVDFFSGKNSHTMSKVASGDKKPAKTQNTGYNRIYRLAELLQTSSNDLRGQLAIEAARNGQIETAIKMSNELYELVPDAKTSQVLYAVAYYLCKLQSDDSKTDKWFSHEIYQLACHAALLCHTDMLCDCMELCKCTRLTDQIFQQCESGDYGVTVQSTASNIPGFQRDPYIEWTYNDFFKEDGLVLDSSIAIPLSNLFNMCCIPRIRPVVDRLPYEHDRLIGQSINDLSDQESQPHLMDLSHIAWEMVSLLQENSLYSLGMAYILKTISEFVLYSTSRNMGFSDAISSQAMDSIMAQLKSKGNVMVQEHTSNLLLKIFGSRKVDISLALGYACILTKEKALDKLKSISTSAGYNYNKVTAVSKVSEELALLYNDSDLVSHCKKMATKSSWGSRLSQLQILFQEAFNTDRTVNYQNLLPQIIEHKNVNIDMLKDYCRDFGLNIDEALWLYLETLLLSDKHMDYGNTSETPLDETLIRSVILQVVNLDTLKCKLEDILDRVNYYDYDRITLILKLMQEFCPLQKTELDNQIMKGMKLFEYLYAYQRVSKPSTYEATFRYKTEEDQLLHGSHPLPELSKTRLPYHPLIHGKPWKIISPELNANTVSSLLPIAEVLKLQGDNMYIVAVQNIVNEVKKQWQLQESLETGSTNVSWNTSRRMNVKTLESFNNLLMKISDRKMAVATCRWIAQEIPRGPDQVLMLKLCCVLAHSWKEISQNDPATLDMATTTLAKFTELHKTLSTEQVLRKYHLTDVTYLRLTNQPARLIFTLYEHKSIEKSFAGSLESLPDIHSAADEISAVNAYNISKIRMTLLENWLPSQHYKKDHMDETAGFNWKSNEISDDERNLRRVIYLLHHGSVEQNASILLDNAFTPDTKLTNMTRVRALRCLFALVHGEIIEKLSSRSISDLRDDLQKLLYIGDLEALNISQTILEFTKCNKEGLVRGLWTNHNHEPKAVKLITDLCIDYEIHDIQLWNSLLQQLMAFNMINYLRHILVRISGVCHLWHISSLLRAWKSVLLQPLTTVCQPLSDEQEKQCHQSLLLMTRCPLISDMDMIGFSKQFLRQQMMAHALACLLIIPDVKKKEQQIKALFSVDGCHALILDQIANLTMKRMLLPQAEQIQGAVFENIIETDNYELLLCTSHSHQFKHYLARNQKISTLLLTLLKTSRYEESLKLIELYYQYNPEILPANQPATMVEKDRKKKLHMYLESHGLMKTVEDILVEFK